MRVKVGSEQKGGREGKEGRRDGGERVTEYTGRMLLPGIAVSISKNKSEQYLATKVSHTRRTDLRRQNRPSQPSEQF